MNETWECTDCGASAKMDVEAKPIQYHSTYTAATGPYARVPVAAHQCPIKAGWLPPRLELAPNARRIE